MKKDKLYTVSKYSADRINEKANLFYPGGFLTSPGMINLYNRALNSSTGSNSSTGGGTGVSISRPDFGQLGGADLNKLDASAGFSNTPSPLGGYTEGQLGVDLSKDRNYPNPPKNWNNNNQILNNVLGAVGAVGNPLASRVISGGYSTGGVGEGVAGIGNVASQFFQDPITRVAIGLGSGILGGVINRGWGVKRNNKNIASIKTNTGELRTSGNQLASATTNEAFMDAAANMGTGTGFKSGDLVKGGWFSGGKAAREANRYLNAEKQALAMQTHAMAQGAKNVDKIQDDNVMANFAAMGGSLNDIEQYADGGYMGALEYGLLFDYNNRKLLEAQARNKIPSNPFGALAVNPFNGYADGGILFRKGGPLIKEENKGKFTAQAKAAGMGTQQFASHVLANKEDYSPTTVKRANFAHVFGGRNYNYGGPLFNDENLFDIGGVLQSHGSDWGDEMVSINAGGSHESNPYDGIQVGVDNNNTPNLVEEGETIYQDYVYSKRISLDDEAKEKFHFSKKQDITYANAAKKLEKEISERPNDPISKAAFKSQMQDLAEEQERQKAEMQAEEAREQFESLSPEEQVAVMQNAQAQEQQAAEEEAMMQEQAAQEQAMQEQAAMQGQPTEEQMMQEQMMAQQQGMMPQQPVGMEAQIGGYAEGGQLGNEYAMGGNLFVDGGPESDLARAFAEASKDDRSILQRIFGVNEVTKFLSNPVDYIAGDKLEAIGNKLASFTKPQLEKFFSTDAGQYIARAIANYDETFNTKYQESGFGNQIKNARRLTKPMWNTVAATAKKSLKKYEQVAKGQKKPQINSGARNSSVSSTGRNFVQEASTQASRNAAAAKVKAETFNNAVSGAVSKGGNFSSVEQTAFGRNPYAGAGDPIRGIEESTALGERLATAKVNDAIRASQMTPTKTGRLVGNKVEPVYSLTEGSPSLLGGEAAKQVTSKFGMSKAGKWAAGLTGAGILTEIGATGYNGADKTGAIDATIDTTDQLINGKKYTAEQFYDQMTSGKKENRDTMIKMMKQVASKQGLSPNLRSSDWHSIYYPLMDSLKSKGVLDNNGNIKINTKRAQAAAVKSTSIQSTPLTESKPQNVKKVLSTADRNKIGEFNSRMRKEFGNGWATRFGLNKDNVQELYQGYIDGEINLDNLVKETRAGLQQNVPAANSTLISTPGTPQNTYMQGYSPVAVDTGSYAPINYDTTSGGYYQAPDTGQTAISSMPPVYTDENGQRMVLTNRGMVPADTYMAYQQAAQERAAAIRDAATAQPVTVTPYDENTLGNALSKAIGVNTKDDLVEWLKKNNVKGADKWDNTTDFNEDMWLQIRNDDNFLNALADKDSTLADALRKGYDYGKYRPEETGVIQDINKGNWKTSGSSRSGGIDSLIKGWTDSEDAMWQEVKDKINNKMSLKEIQDLMMSTNAWKKTTDYLKRSPDNMLAYLQAIQDNPDSPIEARNHYKNFVDIDDKGKLSWKKGFNPTYDEIFGKVRTTYPGTYWHSYSPALRDRETINMIKNSKGEWVQALNNVKGDDWKEINRYSWDSADPDKGYEYIYWNTPEQRAAEAKAKADAAEAAKTSQAAGQGNADRAVAPVLQSEWPRYAGLMGPVVGLGMMAAGIGKPNLSDYEAALDIVNKGGSFASYMPIGNYLKYQPMDIWANQNRMDANSRATDRAILNNASPVGTRNAGLVANSYASQLGSGELYKNALQYNDNLMQNVGTFNRATDMFNAEAFNRTSATNAEIRNRDRQLRAQLGMQTAAEKAAANAGWYNSLYGNVAGLFKGISDLGRENAQRNMISRLAAAGAFGTLTPENAVGAGLVKWADEEDKKKKRNWLSIFG